MTTRKKASWVASSYFAEGLPYAVVHSFGEILFVELGASLGAVGLTSLFHLPWNLKFLWAPPVDTYGTKRGWILGTEALLVLSLLALAAVTFAAPGFAAPAALFFAVAALAATHDIAIDGHYLEALDDAGQARFVGLRVGAYRVALLVVGGPGLVLADRYGFPVVFAASAAVLVALLGIHATGLPRLPAGGKRPPRYPFAVLLGLGLVGVGIAALPIGEGRLWVLDRAPDLLGAAAKLASPGFVAFALLLGLLLLGPVLRRRARGSAYAASFASFLSEPKLGRILFFVLFFRAGESFLQKMKYPFFKSLGMSLESYGWASGTAGMVLAIAAPALGGWLIAKHGLRRWIWPFVLAQNLLNLGFWGLAALPEPPSTALMTAVIGLEMFGAGLGTAVLMVYLNRLPQPGHRAAHFAILTALMSASFTVAGAVSGFAAEALGFGPYFLVTVALGVPAMLVMPTLPYLDGPRSPNPAPVL